MCARVHALWDKRSCVQNHLIGCISHLFFFYFEHSLAFIEHFLSYSAQLSSTPRACDKSSIRQKCRALPPLLNVPPANMLFDRTSAGQKDRRSPRSRQIKGAQADKHASRSVVTYTQRAVGPDSPRPLVTALRSTYP